MVPFFIKQMNSSCRLSLVTESDATTALSRAIILWMGAPSTWTFTQSSAEERGQLFLLVLCGRTPPSSYPSTEDPFSMKSEARCFGPGPLMPNSAGQLLRNSCYMSAAGAGQPITKDTEQGKKEKPMRTMDWHMACSWQRVTVPMVLTKRPHPVSCLG